MTSTILFRVLEVLYGLWKEGGCLHIRQRLTNRHFMEMPFLETLRDGSAVFGWVSGRPKCSSGVTICCYVKCTPLAKNDDEKQTYASITYCHQSFFRCPFGSKFDKISKKTASRKGPIPTLHRFQTTLFWMMGFSGQAQAHLLPSLDFSPHNRVRTWAENVGPLPALLQIGPF